MTMGQATGTAAALAISNNTLINDISITALISELTRQGVNGLGNNRL
jgi:hypothetical protein